MNFRKTVFFTINIMFFGALIASESSNNNDDKNKINLILDFTPVVMSPSFQDDEVTYNAKKRSLKIKKEVINIRQFIGLLENKMNDEQLYDSKIDTLDLSKVRIISGYVHVGPRMMLRPLIDIEFLRKIRLICNFFTDKESYLILKNAARLYGISEIVYSPKNGFVDDSHFAKIIESGYACLFPLTKVLVSGKQKQQMINCPLNLELNRKELINLFQSKEFIKNVLNNVLKDFISTHMPLSGSSEQLKYIQCNNFLKSCLPWVDFGGSLPRDIYKTYKLYAMSADDCDGSSELDLITQFFNYLKENTYINIVDDGAKQQIFDFIPELCKCMIFPINLLLRPTKLVLDYRKEYQSDDSVVIKIHKLITFLDKDSLKHFALHLLPNQKIKHINKIYLFLESMKHLTGLELSNVQDPSLPGVLSQLRQLKTLKLDNCTFDLGDIKEENFPLLRRVVYINSNSNDAEKNYNEIKRIIKGFKKTLLYFDLTGIFVSEKIQSFLKKYKKIELIF